MRISIRLLLRCNSSPTESYKESRMLSVVESAAVRMGVLEIVG